MAQEHGIRAGKAFVELYAKSSLSEGFRKAEAQIRKFASEVAYIGASVAAAGAAVLTPMALATKQFSNEGDLLDKMSLRTGVSAEELSKLGHAAQLSGTSLEATEGGIKRMQKTLEDARLGLAEAKRGYDNLGLSAEKLQSMTPTAALAEIAGKLKEVKNENLRAAIAMQIFGRSGTDLLPILLEGKTGLNAMFNEAEKLGLVVSTETATSAARLNDELYRLVAVCKHVGFVIGSALSDEVQKASRSIVAMAVDVSAWIKQNKDVVVVTAKVAATVTAVGVAVFATGKIINVVVSVVKALTLAKMALAKTMAAVQALMGPKGWLVLAGSLVAAAGAVYALDKAFDKINSQQMDTGQQVEALKAVEDQAGAATIKMGQLRREVASYVNTPVHALGVEADEIGLDRFEKVKLQMMKDNTWNKESEELFNLYKRVILEKEEALSLTSQAQEIIESQTTAQQTYNNEVEKLNRLLNKNLLTQEQYNTELARQDKILADATTVKDPKADEQKRLAGDVYEHTRTPIERYQKEIERLADLRRHGLIDFETYKRAMVLEADKLPKIEKIITEQEYKATATGDFSGFARFGINGESSAERTARATEEIAKNTRDLVQKTEDDGSVV